MCKITVGDIEHALKALDQSSIESMYCGCGMPREAVYTIHHVFKSYITIINRDSPDQVLIDFLVQKLKDIRKDCWFREKVIGYSDQYDPIIEDCQAGIDLYEKRFGFRNTTGEPYPHEANQ